MTLKELLVYIVSKPHLNWTKWKKFSYPDHIISQNKKVGLSESYIYYITDNANDAYKWLVGNDFKIDEANNMIIVDNIVAFRYE